jgi:hypothetical protein
MTKIIKIVENNHVTGIVYGTVNIPDTEAKISHKRAQKSFKESKARVNALRCHHVKKK